MNYICSELQGATYQPRELLEVDNCWIIPACKDNPVLTMSDLKLVFTYQENIEKINGPSIEYLFVYCYQFLFCAYSNIYQFYSLRYLNNYKPFNLNGENIGDIEKQIKSIYLLKGNRFVKNFNNLESEYCTFSPFTVNFQEFYIKFTELFKNDNKFKEIVMLFCETINGYRPLYNNVLQQITQLQTIFETLTGKPSEEKCNYCKISHYVESWEIFLERHMKDYGYEPEDIRMIIKIKGVLNTIARVKYVHNSKYYNPYEIKNLIIDTQTGEKPENDLSVNQIINKKSDSWRGIDWINLYNSYLIIVRNLIYMKFFES